ncbi:CinA family protein [Polynucleobacter sp. MWH-CaK5]|uniref:CinA family protein n=1 Tax=Polynucleobacter sp. MWH-CaK5 TaxID=2689107 RepID=UPI0035304EDD
MNTPQNIDLHEITQDLARVLIKNNWHLSTAESCTGGMVAASITELTGSSEWFERGYVTYSNQSKSEDIDVSQNLIEQHGAVSDQVARAMALGAKQNSCSDLSLSITGIAGPTGGSPEKPIGTVCFAWALANDQIVSETKHFEGNRQQIRQQACDFSLRKLLSLVVA